ncbi:MAG: hypothetical protein ACLS7Z_04295 [Christensenellales bacterium]
MENKKKRRGMLALLLGLALAVCGGALLTRSGGRLEYILPAPAATQEGGELNALYEEAQKQLATIADSVTASAVGARAQGLTLSAEARARRRQFTPSVRAISTWCMKRCSTGGSSAKRT